MKRSHAMPPYVVLVRVLSCLLILLSALGMASCGGGGGTDSVGSTAGSGQTAETAPVNPQPSPNPALPSAHPLTVTVSDLNPEAVSGIGVSVAAAGKTHSSINTAAAGFQVSVSEGQTYQVQITRQPDNGQMCRVDSSSGQMPAAPLSVKINCLTAVDYALTSQAVTMQVGETRDAVAFIQWPESQFKALMPAELNVTAQYPAVTAVNAEQARITGISAGQDVLTFAPRKPGFLFPVKTVQINIEKSTRLHVLRGIDVTQVFAQTVPSTYQILIPNRPVLVRAFVHALDPQKTRPPDGLELVVKTGARSETLPLTCPANVPVGASEPILRYSKLKSCFAWVMDPELVAPGMVLSVQGAGLAMTVNPKVNPVGSLELHLVPVSVAGKTGKIPDLTELKSALLRSMPFHSISLEVDPVFTSDLDESDPSLYSKLLDVLYVAGISSSGHRIGLMPQTPVSPANDHYKGLSYVGFGRISLVQEGDLSSLLHELGHSLGLQHAPCRVSKDVDPFFAQLPTPWAGAEAGLLSDTPMYSKPIDNFINPASSAYDLTKRSDAMGYCGGLYFSEYSYQKLAQFVGGRPEIYSEPRFALQGGLSLKNAELLLQLEKKSAGWHLSQLADPLQAEHDMTAYGEYEIRLFAKNGSSLAYRFNLPVLSDGRTADRLVFRSALSAADIARFEVSRLKSP